MHFLVRTILMQNPNLGGERRMGLPIRQRGFSLIELVLVLFILLAVAGIAVPNIATAIANVRLRGSASDLSGLLQNARMLAVKNNATYTLRFGLPNAQGAYVDLNNNSSFDSTEPMIQFGGTVKQVAAPNGSSGTPSALDGAGGLLGWTAVGGNVSFNPRGLPCDVTKTPCATGVGYVFYLSDTRASASGWAAVSVTAGGRTKVWTWSGTGWID